MTALYIILGVVLVIGLASGLIYWHLNKQESNPPLTVRLAITEARNILQDKENKPDIFRRLKDKSEKPFIPLEANKAKEELPGTYHFRSPAMELSYTCKDAGEKVVILLAGYDEAITLFYSEGVLSGVNRGSDPLDPEHFELRQSGTIADHLRSFIRYHLRFPGGSLKLDKAAEPTFKPVLDLNKGGEIKLKGQPPPPRQPNLSDDD